MLALCKIDLLVQPCGTCARWVCRVQTRFKELKIRNHRGLEAVKANFEDRPRNTERDIAHYQRSRWAMQLLYSSFLRRDEAVNLIIGSFEPSPFAVVPQANGSNDAGPVSFRISPLKKNAWRSFCNQSIIRIS